MDAKTLQVMDAETLQVMDAETLRLRRQTRVIRRHVVADAMHHNDAHDIACAQPREKNGGRVTGLLVRGQRHRVACRGRTCVGPSQRQMQPVTSSMCVCV
jgi:hypothetical protein